MAWIELETETTICLGDARKIDAYITCDVEVDVEYGKGGDGRYIPPDPDEVVIGDAHMQLTFEDETGKEHEIELTGYWNWRRFWDEGSEEVRDKAFEAVGNDQEDHPID